VQVCLIGIESPDIIFSPEFEELCSGQGPCFYNAEISVGFCDGKVQFAKTIFGYLHCVLFIDANQANWLDCFSLVWFGTAGYEKCAGDKSMRE
jgi:hypothetical protein